jgi:hypothetical protein
LRELILAARLAIAWVYPALSQGVKLDIRMQSWVSRPLIFGDWREEVASNVFKRPSIKKHEEYLGDLLKTYGRIECDLNGRY